MFDSDDVYTAKQKSLMQKPERWIHLFGRYHAKRSVIFYFQLLCIETANIV